MEPKVALVHDWLTSYAGADRVLEQMHRLFPAAPIYTLVYAPERLPARFAQYDVRTSFLQRLPGAAAHHGCLLPLMPFAVESLDLTGYDLVLSSSSCCAKGVITRPDAVHLCYCHTPTRYLWDLYPEYHSAAKGIKKQMMPALCGPLRLWDRLAADRVDAFAANSAFVAQRIRKYYRRSATVLYPGVELPPCQEGPREDFYLVVGRLVAYKRVDLAIEACNRLGRRLLIVGEGEEKAALRRLAGPTVQFAGWQPDVRVHRLMGRARALLFPGMEDFGITPVEAQAAGCPVLAYGRGGALETVLPGFSGLFFAPQSAAALAECILEFEREGVAFSPAQMHESTERFSTQRFAQGLGAFVREKTGGNFLPG